MELEAYIKIAKNLFDAAYIVDEAGIILFWNDAACEITGYESKDLVGKQCSKNIFRYIGAETELCCISSLPLKEALKKETMYEGEFSLHHKKGYQIPVDIRCFPLQNETQIVIGAMEIFRRKQDPEKSIKDSLVHGLIQTAYIDPVTNIPNKQYMEQKIKMLLSEAEATSIELLLGLMIIDVRNLVNFNNYGGVELGNLLLKIVARTLMENIELEKGSLVSRWYGGSFIVFIKTNRIPTLLNWANKLKCSIEQSNVPEWEDIPIDVSIYGTVIQENETLPEIIRRLERQWQMSKLSAAAVSIS
jgi:two-component system cell cycle response regulator